MTNQEVILGLSESFPKELEHKVQVYQGALENSTFEEVFSPENHRILKSFELTNVPNVSISGNENAPFPNKRVYTFKKLIIIDPKIIRIFEMKGKTYGELEGKAYGITEKKPQINKLDPPPIDADTGGKGDGNAGNNTGSVGSTDFKEASEIGQSLNRAKTGCLKTLNGCWTNLWKIILAILCILFLWLLVKSCDEMAKDDGVCDRRMRNKKRLVLEKQMRDSLQRIYDKNVAKTLANIKNIYFYQNSTDIHEYSLGSKGSFNRLIELIQTCNDKSFEIIGHHSGATIENSSLDSLRANLVRDKFIENGIKPEHLTLVYKGSKEAKYDKKLNDFLLTDYTTRRYNRNMRVEIKLKQND
jgi:outer membrane protein OmpA-like peptidoglycan-associated protein